MADRFDRSGRVSLVTGATKGLGRAMVQGLAEAGSDVGKMSELDTDDELEEAGRV